jgi:hypothetical protein
MANAKQKKPSVYIETFLDFIDQCKTDYQSAYDAVGDYDKLQQDLLHEMEFAQDKSERNRVATKMHRCRVDRRKNKDAVKELDEIVKFFNEQNNKSTVNKLKQLLGRQRKTEEYLESDRVYKPRKGGMINEN